MTRIQVILVLMGALVFASCGSGGTQGGPAASLVLQPDELTADGVMPFTLGGAVLGTEGETIAVLFLADTGTPFGSGTSALLEVAATVAGDGTAAHGTMPLVGLAETVTAQVAARLGNGSVLGSSGSRIRIHSGDVTAPTVPDPTLTITEQSDYGVTSTVEVSWAPAADETTPPGSLGYRLYESPADDLATAAEVLANGVPVTNWQTDNRSGLAVGLTPESTVYFNVLVRDAGGNTAAYTQTGTTLSPKALLRVIDATVNFEQKRFLAFIKNAAAPLQTVLPAWQDIPLTFGQTHTFRWDGVVEAIGTFGTQPPWPPFPVVPGQSYELDDPPTGFQDNGQASASPTEFELRNTAASESLAADITKGGRIAWSASAISPGQKAVCQFQERMFVTMTTHPTEVPDLTQVNTEISLLGIRTADLIITEPTPGLFQFSLANVTFPLLIGPPTQAVHLPDSHFALYAHLRQALAPGDAVVWYELPGGVEMLDDADGLRFTDTRGPLSEETIEFLLQEAEVAPDPEHRVLGPRELILSADAEGRDIVARRWILVAE